MVLILFMILFFPTLKSTPTALASIARSLLSGTYVTSKFAPLSGCVSPRNSTMSPSKSLVSPSTKKSSKMSPVSIVSVELLVKTSNCK